MTYQGKFDEQLEDFEDLLEKIQSCGSTGAYLMKSIYHAFFLFFYFKINNK